MNGSKMSLLVVGLLVALLGASLGKLAIERQLPWQNAGANRALAKITPPPNAPEPHWQASLSFQDALRIAEANGGKAYSIERETEGGKPVIEVGIVEQEIFVDAENGKILLVENLRQKGDPEDIERFSEAIELQQLAPIPIQEALQAAEQFEGNQAHAIELKNRGGSLVYEVVIELQKVFIDAGNGKVLATETVGQANEGKSPVSSSIQISTKQNE
jgi:uncharacterized membrane protein YkoI